ncbi:putative calpain-like cysteine peptidase putativecysteine peptidase Clan CA family C2 [Leptomonas pyrrhocoris]|uniref:Putative calpain-like cysteine peptidase putativecysteine peptidase Clan CA family C2 n=1 Tax=Leptomonas pyrrhocoris TaxID=157538 RepID=A0A0N0DTD6_LEPPY|nr:putative calpain-like cysteine peptidase putativecysteine peptidase Clan CA family C2 [Leptomonas pyrrhocoris]KPA77272.1 putative calpain-like cysteine peptidase putativecysteine peptidase Clan CA family C2 [Leptomonas pyrrhocoris]|eukprot:XP_015655711.1 putative calpain-like cysteine peptidase putativecysteine peptidase Clan CA family C2 [Leptomonas pyrrhocoris]
MYGDRVHYENGQPTYTGDTVVKCFKDNGNGLLFRIVNNDEYRWAFYNDTTNYNMVVKVSFGKDSKVEPLMNTKTWRNERTAEFEFELHIAPTQTEMFIEGEPNGFKMVFTAEDMSTEGGDARELSDHPLATVAPIGRE